MAKLKLYVYPHAPGHLHDRIPEYVDKVPFSQVGLAKHCDIVGPDEADFFYMGQYHDNDSWMLEPNRFEFFKGNERMHLLDLEGDWRNKEIPDWLCDSIMTAMDAYPKHRYWNLMVRPGMSKLLAELHHRDLPSIDFRTRKKLFFFSGQMDSLGLRPRVLTAVLNSGCEHSLQVNGNWSAQESLSSSIVTTYEESMKSSMFALCPCGEGIGVRFLEACYYGAIPILIDDHVPFGFDHPGMTQFYFHIPASISEREMIRALRSIFMTKEEVLVRISDEAQQFFESQIRNYLDDPTAYFIDWAVARGLPWGN